MKSIDTAAHHKGGALSLKLRINEVLALSLCAAFLTACATTDAGDDRTTSEVVETSSINYVTGDPSTWPEALEATVAAPDNHKILLENDEVRVLEVTLAPGETEPLHFHRWPSVLHIQEAGQWMDRDADGNVIMDTRDMPPMPLPLTMWKEPEAPHSPVNLSDDIWIRLIRVELKTSSDE